ncbi:MAG: hypothetical protein GX491_15525 [Chloroflexi bacterium]|nr:hypothetical protein [Chloroflexota bacterium]
MPRLSVWTLRAALLYLLAGFTAGALMLANKGQPFWLQVWSALPAHIEFLLFGWTAQLALGVAFWILPRYPGGSRGNETLAKVSILLLNLGILLTLLRGIAPPFLLSGRLCEVLAGILFVLHAWGRIKPLY